MKSIEKGHVFVQFQGYRAGFGKAVKWVRRIIYRESREEFGFRCELSGKTIERIENCDEDYQPKWDTICRICMGSHLLMSQFLILSEQAGFNRELAASETDSVFIRCFEEFYPYYDVEEVRRRCRVMNDFINAFDEMNDEEALIYRKRYHFF